MPDNNFLPGMGRGSNIGKAVSAAKNKLPHQMTPEEFAAAPNAVFHTSHLAPDEVRNSMLRAYRYYAGYGSSPHIHVGSEQAAIENASRTERVFKSDVPAPARLHVFHYTPGSGDNLEVHVDGERYTKPGVEQGISTTHSPTYDPRSEVDTAYDYKHDYHDFPALAYKNDVEDSGSISFSIGDPSRLKSQADYVKEAIAQGKADEVHPKTMAMYKSGALHSGAILPEGFAYGVNLRSRGMTPGGRVSNGVPIVLKPLDPEISPYRSYSPPQTYGFPEEWEPPSSDSQIPKQRYSTNGPDLDTLRKMAQTKKDQ